MQISADVIDEERGIGDIAESVCWHRGGAAVVNYAVAIIGVNRGSIVINYAIVQGAAATSAAVSI